MEFVFKKLTSISATFILIILSAIFIVLFIYSKPAIKEYGLKFLIDPRWGVTIKIPKSNPSNLSISDKKTAVSGNLSQEKLGTKSDNEDDNSLLNDDSDNDNNLLNDDSDNSNNDSSLNNDSDNDDNLLNSDSDDDSDLMGNDNEANSNYVTKEIYGGLIPIVGTILSTIIALLFAVPIAMGIAIFLSEIAPPFLSKPVGIAIELLAAIPSIIYGMWGLFYFGPFVSKIVGGPSVNLLVAGLVLGVMIIPFMASLTRDSMNTTPNVLKESAYALGATKFEVIKDVIFPYAKSGIIGSIILALGRALGETMAVAFVIGGVFKLPKHLTDPTVSIPVVLANNFAESSGMSMAALFYLALVLFVISFIVIVTAKFYFLRNKK
ncbi:phosphate transport system permease protein [Lebetimonas natsushimae]|uniref:Phosphate transport system permease protein n=1 Tax=Lebetimonas natsushimae TaxID=1936991 RepID=A0A292YA65_9BACT|nr:phosphate ABC transporter permease subunit PstC [Lebetimonas natsushimae]GAX87802.1 phosphate transport system permease protein [Lebetimonas natsushimae]